MSNSIRQSRLFAAEDYKKIFKAYSFIDYTAYDFTSLRDALINYIRAYYPEDFNDYIESSEFVAIIELIAYLGTSVAFRADMNSRDNFIDTAQRRESIIRLAQMVNYVPRRNIAASGLFKINAVQTNEHILDANGVDLSNTLVFWNDPNNRNWFDQFTQVCNAAFSQTNPFGRPSKSGSVGGISTDLYSLNNVLRMNVVYPTSVNINGQQYPVDVCNPDFIDGQRFYERDPDPLNAFNFIYRNDTLGASSNNTGFFLYFRQGSLTNIDASFTYPVPNRTYNIGLQDINQDDVYVQETDNNGNVIAKWKKVPALSGENIVYNSIALSERNIFDVISGVNDDVTIRFSDGNFGNVPVGSYRIWVRTSANEYLTIRPEAAQRIQLSIPYVGVDGQEYDLTIVFSLEQTVTNSSPSETDEQIKLRAPEVFSTQSRMVNGSDYNVLPLVYGNQLAKVKAVNRTYSGHSRYIDLNDPTGFHKNLIVFGEDAAFYKESRDGVTQHSRDPSNEFSVITNVFTDIQELLRSEATKSFFYDEYLTQFENTIRVNPAGTGRSILDLSTDDSPAVLWKTLPTKSKNSTGYFSYSDAIGGQSIALVNSIPMINGDLYNFSPLGMIKSGAVLDMHHMYDPKKAMSVGVMSVINNGISTQALSSTTYYSDIGPVEMSVDVPNNYRISYIRPVFRNELTAPEMTEITDALSDGVSFWIYYDLLRDKWGISKDVGFSNSEVFIYPKPDDVNGAPGVFSDWTKSPSSGIAYVGISNAATKFRATVRGQAYVFQSQSDVRFYWEQDKKVINSNTGRAITDTIEVLPYVNSNASVDNNDPVIVDPNNAYLKRSIMFNILDVYTQEDGHTDTSRVDVILADVNNDGIYDTPSAVRELISPDSRVILEYTRDPVTQERVARPYSAKWDKTLSNTSGSLFVNFPVNPSNAAELYGAPFISNIEVTNLNGMLDPSTIGYNLPGFMYCELDNADVVFVNYAAQLLEVDSSYAISVANQLSAFLNGPTSLAVYYYPWLDGTRSLNNKLEILQEYFFKKTFLVDSVSKPGSSLFMRFNVVEAFNLDMYPSGMRVVCERDDRFYDRNGKVFTQNTSVPVGDRIPFHFKWMHYAPFDQRVDPAASNIIDMIGITASYYNEVMLWKSTRGSKYNFPIAPTTEELRIQFQDLGDYKMISDSMIWNSGKFKVLFGNQAAPELQADFKVVKSLSSNVTDNEIKVAVVNAIDNFFDIRNWDFGEKFFYTELATYIHQELSSMISSVVIVPKDARSKFGDLFEITATEYELFISTATVDNVQIVSDVSPQTIRSMY